MSQKLQSLRALNIAVSVLCMLTFGGLLAYLAIDTVDFERRVQTVLLAEVEQDVTDRLADWQRIASGAGNLFPATAVEKLQAAQQTRMAVNKLVGAVVGSLCHLDCSQQAATDKIIEEIYRQEFASMPVSLDILRGWVEDHYQRRLAGLFRDVTVFLVSNLLVTTLALGLAVARGAAARHLLPVSALLSITTITAAGWYLFGQDWITTIVFADCFGWGYLGLIAILFLLLADIALNRGRVIADAIQMAFNNPIGTC